MSDKMLFAFNQSGHATGIEQAGQRDTHTCMGCDATLDVGPKHFAHKPGTVCRNADRYELLRNLVQSLRAFRA